MKKLLWLLPVLTVIMLICAFKPTSKNQLLSEAWFEYIGDQNGNAYANPANFVYNPSASCETGAAELCRIYVLSDGQSTPLPDEDALDDMQTEITGAIGHEESENVKLKP